MNALEQRVEVEPAVSAHDDLAVDDAAVGERAGERRRELGEITLQRLVIPARDVDVIVVPEHDRAKAVPLGLVDPLFACGDVVAEARQHRIDGRRNRQRHPLILSASRPSAPRRRWIPRTFY